MSAADVVELDRWLPTFSGVFRSQIRKLIKKGNVTVNGEKPEHRQQLLEDGDEVVLIEECGRRHELKFPQGLVTVNGAPPAKPETRKRERQRSNGAHTVMSDEWAESLRIDPSRAGSKYIRKDLRLLPGEEWSDVFSHPLPGERSQHKVYIELSARGYADAIRHFGGIHINTAADVKKYAGQQEFVVGDYRLEYPEVLRFDEPVELYCTSAGDDGSTIFAAPTLYECVWHRDEAGWMYIPPTREHELGMWRRNQNNPDTIPADFRTVSNLWFQNFKQLTDSAARGWLNFVDFVRGYYRVFIVPVPSDNQARLIVTTCDNKLLPMLNGKAGRLTKETQFFSYNLLAPCGGEWPSTANDGHLVADDHTAQAGGAGALMSRVASNPLSTPSARRTHASVTSTTHVPPAAAAESLVPARLTPTPKAADTTDGGFPAVLYSEEEATAGSSAGAGVSTTPQSGGRRLAPTVEIPQSPMAGGVAAGFGSPATPAGLYLFPHQVRTVAWMQSREESEPIDNVVRVAEFAEYFGLFAYRSGIEARVLSGATEVHCGRLPRGGVVGHPVGAGKTVIAAALFGKTRGAGPTLVCVPDHIVMQWVSEVNRFVPELDVQILERDGHRRLQTCICDESHCRVCNDSCNMCSECGGIRAEWAKLICLECNEPFESEPLRSVHQDETGHRQDAHAAEAARFDIYGAPVPPRRYADVCVAPYSLFEHADFVTAMARICWHRVCFDEPQDIAEAAFFPLLVSQIRAHHRWVLTATPSPLNLILELMWGEPMDAAAAGALRSHMVARCTRRDPAAECLPVPALHMHMVPVTLSWQETSVVMMYAMQGKLQETIRLCSYFADVDNDDSGSRTRGPDEYQDLDEWLGEHKAKHEKAIAEIRPRLEDVVIAINQSREHAKLARIAEAAARDAADQARAEAMAAAAEAAAAAQAEEEARLKAEADAAAAAAAAAAAESGASGEGGEGEGDDGGGSKGKGEGEGEGEGGTANSAVIYPTFGGSAGGADKGKGEGGGGDDEDGQATGDVNAVAPGDGAEPTPEQWLNDDWLSRMTKATPPEHDLRLRGMSVEVATVVVAALEGKAEREMTKQELICWRKADRAIKKATVVVTAELEETDEVFVDSGVDPYLVEEHDNLTSRLHTHETLLSFLENVQETLTNPDAECGVCMDDLQGSLVTMLPCFHAYCATCVVRVFGTANSAPCPMCRRRTPKRLLCTFRCNEAHEFDDEDLGAAIGAADSDVAAAGNRFVGSKIETLVRSINAVLRTTADDKILVFAQWRELLGNIAGALTEAGINNLVLEGDMHGRAELLASFQSDPAQRVLLLSSEHHASGANLHAANHVFIVHPYCPRSVAAAQYVPLEAAQTFERQAIGRVHRYPQHKDVHVYRLYSRGTVEEDLYAAWGWT